MWSEVTTGSEEASDIAIAVLELKRRAIAKRKVKGPRLEGTAFSSHNITIFTLRMFVIVTTKIGDGPTTLQYGFSQRARFQTLSSVSFLALTEFPAASSVSSSRPNIRVPK